MKFRAKRPGPEKAPTSATPSTLVQDSAASPTEASRAHPDSDPTRDEIEAVENPEQKSVEQPTLRGHQFGKLSVAPLQPKLAVSQPADPLEQEADRIADQVVGLGEPENPNHQEKAERELERKRGSQPIYGHVGVDEGGAESDPPEVPTAEESLVASTLGSGGAPLSTAALNYMQPRFGHDFSKVRVYTDDQASQSARALGAHAYTVGTDIVFSAGTYTPGTDAGNRLLAHELTHVVQQTGGVGLRESANPTPIVQRQKDQGGTATAPEPSTLDQLRQAEDAAAKEDTLSPALGGMTNIGDVTTARAAIEKVKIATATLEMGDPGGWVGEKGEAKHKAANAEVEQLLGFYIGFTGEETRTGVDFMDRYKKAHAQFARLQGLAQQYEQMTGVSAASSKGMLEMEAAAKSAEEARKKFDAEKAKLSPEKAADITAAQAKLAPTETAMSDCKKHMDTAATDARTGFLSLTNATATISQAAEKEKAEEKKAEVEKVKGEIAEMQKWIAGGIELAVTVATAGVGGAAKAGAVSATEMSQAAIEAMKESGTEEVKKMGKEKAQALVKQAAEDIGGTIAAEHYKLELARAEGALAVANKMVAGYGKEIGANEARIAALKWAQGMRTLQAEAAEFDRLQKVMRDQIRDLGRAISAAGIGKQEGARYEVIAEFRAEVTAFVNEADAAIALGKQAQGALKEGGERRSQAAYDRDQSRVYYDAYKWHDGRWKLRMNYLNLGVRKTAGEGGMVEKIDTLVAELEQYRKNAETYRLVLANAMGASV